MSGAVCPERGIGAAVVLPHVNVEAMNLRLAEISRSVTHGAHAVLVLDQAGWHTSHELRVPEPRKSRCDFADVSLLPLPPYAPELNPVENVWAYLRANFLGHCVWNSYNAIADACCDAWNKLMNVPQRLASITRRIWAKAVNGWDVWYDANVMAHAEGVNGLERETKVRRLLDMPGPGEIVIPVQAPGELRDVLTRRAEWPAAQARAAVLA